MPLFHQFVDSNGKWVSMLDRPFVAIVPKKIQFDDEIILKGKIKNNALDFSVNFTLDCGENVAYQFKTDFANNTVLHNSKTNGKWNGETAETNSWIDGPGQQFVLTFHFTDSDVLVYSDDENRNFISSFEYQFDIGDIRSVQVWDDIDYINEIIFRY